MARPERAQLAPRVRARLRRLARHPRVGVAVLSGRTLDDVRARVGVPRVVYGGCHGLEIAGAGLGFRPPPAWLGRLAAARRALKLLGKRVPGVRLEDKRLALAVHYRRVPPAYHGALRALVRRLAGPGLGLIAGKGVVDLVPAGDWDKGRAACWIAARLSRGRGRGRPVVLYAGDDATDERAFAALRGLAVTVRVGRGRGRADHAVAGVRGMQSLLTWLERVIVRGGRAARGSRGGGA